MICARCGFESEQAFKFCPECGAAGAARTEERRKPATILFCDVSGSTAMGERLDAEAVRELMFTCFHEVREAIERHGGTVEKFVGDAVMAVFGVPEAHEDDPLRACRAAFEMQERMAVLNEQLQQRYGNTLALRIGVNTGEVVAGDASTRETFVSGDAVNVAARLEQAAAPGEILLGHLTRLLASSAIDAEAVEPVRAKGKREPVPAFRLLAVSSPRPARRTFETPFVGRTDELEHLADTFARAATGRLVIATIVGEPGVGKSRLASALVDRIGRRARFLSGRCLAYGEGITWWPLAEIVRSAAGIHDEHDVDQARARLERLALDPAATATIAGLLGLDDRPILAEDVPRAVTRLLEALAAQQPLLLLLEDLHWAEPALLDLVLELGERVRAPVLVVATARPELLETRADWPGVVALDVLDPKETETLLSATSLPESAREAAARACGGNPLFAEELAAFLVDQPEASVLPPTLGALLAARLDLLSAAERSAAERGSVEGELFHRGAVASLSAEPDRAAVPGALAALAARDLVRPARAQFAGEAAYRFKHALVRDAVYTGTAKRLRAELHERFGGWLVEKAGGRLAELEELVGYHLEQAHRYRTELGLADEELATRAGAHLAAAGERAYSRDDMPAAVNLLDRALALPSRRSPRDRVELSLRLASALLDMGRTADAEAAADAAAGTAAAAGDRAGELRAMLFRGQTTAFTTSDYGELLPLAGRALPVFEETGDSRGSMEAWRVFAGAALAGGRYAEAADSYRRALDCARRLASYADEREILGWLEYVLLLGPTPVREVLRWAGEASLPLEELEPSVSGARAVLLALDGRLAEARALCAAAETRAQESGMQLWLAVNTDFAWDVETLAGDLPAAEQQARRGHELYRAAESTVGAGLAAGNLAQSLCAQGRHDEAERWSEICEQEAGSDGAVWRQVRAKVLARRGELELAERLAREAVALTEQTDSLRAQADALLDLAEALELGGRGEDAAGAVARAVDLYERKGALVPAERARASLASAQSRS